jgi:hypothetical protein
MLEDDWQEVISPRYVVAQTQAPTTEAKRKVNVAAGR